MIGKSIRLFLIDGSPTGLMTAEIGQWTGKAMVCPRQSLPKLASRDEARRPGVYILAGADPQRPGRERVYIGEAENVYDRLKQHDKDEKKEWWQRVCLFAAADQSLTKAHIKFLESRLVELAYAAERAEIENGNTPTRPALPEADIADMEVFLAQALVLLPVIGFRFALALVGGESSSSELSNSARASESQAERFYLRAKGAEATARVTDEAFVVLKGSTASNQDTASWTTFRSQRDEMLSNGQLINHPDKTECYLFTENVPFSSPSAAGAIICARSTNGRTAWKTQGGKTYADWQEARQLASEEGA